MKNISDMLNQFKQSADTIREELSAQVLDGTPYVIALAQKDEAGSFDLLKGYLYNEDGTDSKQLGFRYQRRFDLCGCVCYSPESADRQIAVLSQRPGLAAVRKVHARDWLRAQLDGLKKSVALLENSLTKGQPLPA